MGGFAAFRLRPGAGIAWREPDQFAALYRQPRPEWFKRIWQRSLAGVAVACPNGIRCQGKKSSSTRQINLP